MGEILDENTRLRELNQAQAAQLEAQAAQLAQLGELQAKLEALQSSHDLLTKHLEFLDKKRKLAQTERFIADKNQALLFDGAEVTLPPRDPRVEQEDADRPDESADKRKTAQHPRKGRRKLEDLKLPKVTINAPVIAPDCERCGGEQGDAGTEGAEVRSGLRGDGGLVLGDPAGGGKPRPYNRHVGAGFIPAR